MAILTAAADDIVVQAAVCADAGGLPAAPGKTHCEILSGVRPRGGAGLRNARGMLEPKRYYEK